MATIRNKPDDVLKFTGLTFEDIEPSRIDFFLSLAAERVEARSPIDTEDDRSNRLDALRTEASLYLTAGYIYETLANTIAIGAPDNRIFTAGTGGTSIGADSPHFLDIQGAFFRSAQRMFDRGEAILKQISPITNTIEAV